MRSIGALFILTAMLFAGAVASASSGATVYTLPSDIAWQQPPAGSNVGPGVKIAFLHGTAAGKCGALFLWKFPDGQGAGWHVNGRYNIFTILKGTLVIGFDRRHAKSAERTFPAGSVVQGLKSEPHYGRAVGETIFEVYRVCGK